jgi:hypothetical protein
MAQVTVVAKLQLAPALLLFKKYLIKKWFFLSLALPIRHPQPATPEAGASNKHNEHNNM